METVQQLEAIYDKYQQDLAKVYKDAKPMDGLFGWGDDPRKDPCHMRFYEAMEQWIGGFSAREPEEVYPVVRYVLTFPAAHREKHCFWFTFAAQGLIRDLIPFMTAAQCREMREFYDEAYPKRERMPVQKDVYKLLKKHAGR